MCYVCLEMFRIKYYLPDAILISFIINVIIFGIVAVIDSVVKCEINERLLFYFVYIFFPFLLLPVSAGLFLYDICNWCRLVLSFIIEVILVLRGSAALLVLIFIFLLLLLLVLLMYLFFLSGYVHLFHSYLYLKDLLLVLLVLLVIFTFWYIFSYNFWYYF